MSWRDENDRDAYLEYKREEQVKQKVEEEYRVDWETYQMLVQ